jgi:hypothetical protein
MNEKSSNMNQEIKGGPRGDCEARETSCTKTDVNINGLSVTAAMKPVCTVNSREIALTDAM